MKKSLEDRLWAKINRSGPEECWEWTGARISTGYGRIRINGRTASAHRTVYELFVKPIPDGLTIDHLCRNRACMNPRHMEPVSHKVNTLRGNTVGAVNQQKMTCPKGHTYDRESFNGRYRDGTRKRRRYCSICIKETQKHWRARQRALMSKVE